MDEQFEVAEQAFEIDQNVKEMIAFVKEQIGDETDTIEVPVIVLTNLCEMLSQLNTCVKSLYEFSAIVMETPAKES